MVGGSSRVVWWRCGVGVRVDQWVKSGRSGKYRQRDGRALWVGVDSVRNSGKLLMILATCGRAVLAGGSRVATVEGRRMEMVPTS